MVIIRTTFLVVVTTLAVDVLYHVGEIKEIHSGDEILLLKLTKKHHKERHSSSRTSLQRKSKMKRKPFHLINFLKKMWIKLRMRTTLR